MDEYELTMVFPFSSPNNMYWFQEMSLNQNLLSSLAIFAPLLIVSFNFFESILIVICYSLLHMLSYVAFCPSSLCDCYKYEFIGDFPVEPF